MLDFISTSDHGKPYYDGLLVTAEFREQHAKLIQKFTSGHVKLDAKKGTPHCLLTTKTSKSDRVMFATVKVEHNGITFKCLTSLEDIENHDYQKSTFLNHSGAFRVFQENLPQQVNVASFSNVAETIIELNPDDSEDSTKLESAYVYNHKYVILSDIQNQLFEKPLPLIVNGGAGAGKSLTGLLKLASLLELANDGAPKKLLYVTESKKLVAQMRENWNNLPLVERPVNVDVEFITYDELLKKARPELVNATRVNDKEKSHFKAWLTDYAKSQKNKPQAAPQASKAKANTKRGKLIKGKQQASTQSPFDSIVANPDRLYQEFRIISGYSHTPKVYITELGAKQSLFSDTKQRDLCFQAYQAYLSYLTEQNQYDASFTPFALAEQDKYDSTICDEWLDGSPLQSQQLLDSTYNAQIVYCGDINQSLTDTKPSYPFLQRLCHEREITLSELDLPGSYRCPPPVIEFANAVLDIKHALVGSAVKKTQGRISSTEFSESHTSNIVWLEKISAEEKSQFNDLTQSTDFVIITLPAYEANARLRFPNATIFTPAEIKGLEYRAVMLYRIFEDPICAAANNLFSPENISDGPIHRPKFSADVDPAYHPFFNSIYTAMTRTTESLYVYQPLHHPTSKITGYLKEQLKTDAPGQIQTDNFTPATREQLIAEVMRLWNNDNQKQAQQIIEREQLAEEPQIQALLNPAEESTEPKVVTLRSATSHEQKQFDTLCRCKNLAKFNKELNKVKDLGVFFNEIIFNITPQKSNSYNLLTLIFTSENGMLKTPEINSLRNYFSKVIENPPIALKIFSGSFFSPISSAEQKLKNFVSAVMLLGDKKLGPLVINAIKQHLHNKTPTLRCILDNLFLVSEIESKRLMLFFGLKNEAGTYNTDLSASLILEKYRLLSDEQMVEQLFLPNELFDNSSPFFILTAYKDFLDVLKKLFEKRPGLYNFISIAHLMKEMPRRSLPNVFSNLINPTNIEQSSINFDFLLELFEKNKLLVINPKDFVLLCMSSNRGNAFLQYLFDKNPKLLDRLPVSALFANEKDFEECACYYLARTESGLELIRNILKRDKKICQELTVADLPQIQKVISLLMSKQAYDIVEYLFENNPKLAIKLNEKEINYPALKAIIEKHLANALRNSTEKEKTYLQQFLSIRATEKSLLAFLNHKDAVDYLLNIRVNDSNVLSEIALKNPENLQVLLSVLIKNPHLLQKFCNPALFRVRGNQGGDSETRSTLKCLEALPAGKELITIIFEKPKVIQLRKATSQEQQQFNGLVSCKNTIELRIALARISNLSEFFNEIAFDLTPPDETKVSLIVFISTYDGDPNKFPKFKNFGTLLYDLLQTDNYIKTAIFSESFFSLVETQTPGVQTTGALATIRFDFRPFIKSTIIEHLKYQTSALACLLDNFFLKGQFENAEFRIFGFLLNEAGNLDINLIVTLILEKYKNLSDEQIWQQLCQPISLSSNESPLLILTVGALSTDILKELFNKKPSFYQFITADQLLREYPICDFSLSLFSNLIANHCFDFLYNLCDRTAIDKQFDRDLFYSFPNGRASNFITLCKPNENLKFLNYLYERNPALLERMTYKDLLTRTNSGTHAFHGLIMCEDGINILRKILNAHKEFCQHITMEDFVVNIENKSIRTYQLLLASQCYDIFELMFENNRNLTIEFSKQENIKDQKFKDLIQKYLPAVPSVATNPSSFHYHSEKTAESPEESEHITITSSNSL